MGDRRLGDRELVSQMLAGAALLVSNGLEDGYPSGVGQGLRDELKLSRGQGRPR
jgi:hypothetical protein